MRVESLQLDDRREIWVLLSRLNPVNLLRFMEWCCQETPEVLGVKMQVTKPPADSNEAYYDLMQLSTQGLDLERAACELERRVKRGALFL